MIKKFHFYLLLIFLLCNCSKEDIEFNNFVFVKEEITYNLKDSIIIQTDNWVNPGTVLYELHFQLNRDITIYKLNDTNKILYLSDTFVLYNSANKSYKKQTGSFPLISFKDSSITFSTLLDGIHVQTWKHIVGATK